MTDPRTILFVCSGNTCRSPMAEAIARHLLAVQAVSSMRRGQPAGPSPLLIRSAGIGALEGEPATPEARRALKALGIEMGPHRAKSVTPRMIADADEILTMTGSHRRAVIQIHPSAESKITPVDPDGDVQDPIGGPESVYAATARRLLEVIRRRFEAAGWIEA